MSKYQKKKESLREEAVAWQMMAGETALYWSDILGAGEYFEKQGRKYGLLREFRENGIL